MVFGSKNRKPQQQHILTEENIRLRLYGSAVAADGDSNEEVSKKNKSKEEKPVPTPKKELRDEQIKIRQELELLKKDLERAKRKLYKMRGLQTKKIRLLAIYLAVFLIAGTAAVLVIKHLAFSPVRAVAVKETVKPLMPYTIQVAVYGSGADAQRFERDLASKGYEAFVKESRFGSGKDKFTVYVGGFRDKATAAEVLNRLKVKEGIKGSFVTSMPE